MWQIERRDGCGDWYVVAELTEGYPADGAFRDYCAMFPGSLFRMRRVVHEAAELIDRWNKATDPGALRSEHEHKRQSQRARAIMNRLERRGYSLGNGIGELSNGMRHATR